MFFTGQRMQTVVPITIRTVLAQMNLSEWWWWLLWWWLMIVLMIVMMNSKWNDGWRPLLLDLDILMPMIMIIMMTCVDYHNNYNYNDNNSIKRDQYFALAGPEPLTIPRPQDCTHGVLNISHPVIIFDVINFVIFIINLITLSSMSKQNANTK